jgi:hypothetical protein
MVNFLISHTTVSFSTVAFIAIENCPGASYGIHRFVNNANVDEHD